MNRYSSYISRQVKPSLAILQPSRVHTRLLLNRKMASHTEDFDVVRVAYESEVPIKVALERLNAEVKSYYQNKPEGGHPKHFDGMSVPRERYDSL